MEKEIRGCSQLKRFWPSKEKAMIYIRKSLLLDKIMFTIRRVQFQRFSKPFERLEKELVSKTWTIYRQARNFSIDPCITSFHSWKYL